MKTTKTLSLIAAAAMVAAAFTAHAADPRWERGARGGAAHGNFNRVSPAARVAAPTRPAVAQREFRRAHFPAVATHRADGFIRPVFWQRPVNVHRHVSVQRPVYVGRQGYYPRAAAIAYGQRAPAYFPVQAHYRTYPPAYYSSYDSGPNIGGVVGGAVIGGIIGNAIGSQSEYGHDQGAATAIGAIIGGLIGSGF